jgi:hypothetical protein
VNSRATPPEKNVRVICLRRKEEDQALLGKVTLAGTETEPIEARLVGDLTKPQIGIEAGQGSPNTFWPKRLWGVLGRHVFLPTCFFQKSKVDSLLMQTPKLKFGTSILDSKICPRAKG